MARRWMWRTFPSPPCSRSAASRARQATVFFRRRSGSRGATTERKAASDRARCSLQPERDEGREVAVPARELESRRGPGRELRHPPQLRGLCLPLDHRLPLLDQCQVPAVGGMEGVNCLGRGRAESDLRARATRARGAPPVTLEEFGAALCRRRRGGPAGGRGGGAGVA